MSGHSKWSKVKHQKATTDVKKAAAFTKSARAISIAITEGGKITDPNLNFHLRLAIEKARDVNVPKENIDRIILKYAGGGEKIIENVIYESYGPGGTALLVEVATDNKQRTVSALKNILEHNGATLVGQGSVSYLFDPVGILVIEKQNFTFEQILGAAVEAGASDVEETSDFFEVYTNPQDLNKIKNKFENQKFIINNMEIIRKPKTLNELDAGHKESLLNLLEQLNDSDDIQKVYTNANL
jgi:YebC/PmpR family DNA-binding regulatory protein